MRIGGTIYLDHQSTTPVDERVLVRMMPYFSESFANPHSIDHSLGWQAAKAVEEAAGHVAGLIGADSDEIIFTSGATEANSLALLGVGRRLSAGTRRRVLVSAIEHKCILSASRALREQLGYIVELLPVDHEGRIKLDALENTLADDILLISVMAVNNEIGTVQDVARIREIAHRVGAIFHCDAAQAPLAIDLSGIADQVDLLSLSAHKMYGPKGIGALFVRRNLLGHIEPLIYGGGQQHGLRSGTLPVGLCVGMGAAAALCVGHSAAAERESLRRRRDNLVEHLMALRFQVGINGAASSERHPGNVNACFRGFDAHDILGALQPRLAASTGAACASGIPEPSHVLTALGLSIEDARASIRFSIGRGTTDCDIESASALISEALERLVKSEFLPS